MNYRKIFASLNETGGASFKPDTNILNPQSGYMVALKGHEEIWSIPTSLEGFKQMIKDYIADHYTTMQLKGQANNIYVGLWVNNGVLYVDLSERFAFKQPAINAGIARNQIAIWDCENKTEINTQQPVVI